ncbi:MAG: discoidin domain-containing protein [Spirochaetales bacterium]|nr:discoidin domain-containing protein [Spirochaetales bacterium]
MITSMTAKRKKFILALICITACFSLNINMSFGQTAVTQSGIMVTVWSDGRYTVAKNSPAWTFSGSLNQSIAPAAASGSDGIGAYSEIYFNYDSNRYTGRIRVYSGDKPVAQFITVCNGAQTNIGTNFPDFTTIPAGLYTHGYVNDQFSPRTWDVSKISISGPAVYYDASKNACIVSPADNFFEPDMLYTNTRIAVRFRSWATGLPAGFTHRTLMVLKYGTVLGAWELLGNSLMAIYGKNPPANDADMSIKYIGYWTDNGAYYYYNTGGYSIYEDALLGVRDRYHNILHVRLGYMQLDSWWYIKDPNDPWNRPGCYLYEPVSSFFPRGIADFRNRLGMPLMTHNRWIGGTVDGDIRSPYRDTYTMSRGVSIDPNFWNRIIGDIASWGVKTYEQDWLNINAHPEDRFGDGEKFMRYMAEACKANGLTMQYCMEKPKHFLQAAKYDNVTTLRVCKDGFADDMYSNKAEDWKELFWTSPFVKAVGSWPWVDVFDSNDGESFLLCVLSAGMVGMEDQIGYENYANILKAVRRDGVVVKPDVPILPSDDTYVRRARDGNESITAFTYSNITGKKIVYVFDWASGSYDFKPVDFGLSGNVYVYRYFDNNGFLTNAANTVTDNVTGWEYYVITPIGTSGIGLIGDKGKWVTAGTKRISGISETADSMTVTVQFGPFDQNNPDEKATIIGYSATPVAATAGSGAVVSNFSYDSDTLRFQFDFTPDGSYNTVVSRNVTLAKGGSVPVTVQAEDFSSQSGCAVASEHTGYTGTGYLDFGGNGTYGEWNNVYAAQAGTCNLSFRYAAGTNRQCELRVNGTVAGNAAFSASGGWTTWVTETRSVYLNAGNNTVRLTANTDAGGPNLDKLDVTVTTPATPTPTSTPPATNTPTSTPPAANTPTPTAIITATPSSTSPPANTNLALNRPAESSSDETASYAANNAVDGNTGTRWSSAFSDPQWIMVDLGAVYNISRVVLNWEAAYGSAYQIQVSGDANSWTTIYTASNETGGVDDISGVSGSGRYVRMYGTARGTEWGYSLWEFEVYGSGGSTAAPTATPTNTNAATSTPTPTQIVSTGFSENFNDNTIGSAWTTYGGSWSESGGILRQDSTSQGDPCKAIVSGSGLNLGSNHTVMTKVYIDTWADGDSARAGVSLFTGTGDGRGYNLLFHNNHSTVQWLDDMVAWGTSYTFNWSDRTWYWFKLKMENGTLYGKVWQDGTAEPSSWPYAWTRSGRTGYPALNGGTSGHGGSCTVFFDDVTVTVP